MMDFVDIKTQETKNSTIVYPEFKNSGDNDLMIKGGDFYAFWNEDTGLWDKRKKSIIAYIDRQTKKVASEIDGKVTVKLLDVNSSGKWKEFVRYCKDLPDNYHPLDRKVTFQDSKVKKDDYVSVRLPYSLGGDSGTAAYDELMNVLYEPEEREKIEWAIGSIIAGDSRTIQKFFVLYGPGGTGKSTVLNIIQKLFDGYWEVFVSADLASSGASFALEPFKDNPLIGIEHDGDLSKIEINTRLNSLVSHEKMTMNEKRKSLYSMKVDSLLFIGTNSPVRITDAKSGLIRRLIDISPTGNLIPSGRYVELMNQIDFELGGIARHCLDLYLDRGKHYFDNYKTTRMLDQTNDMYNFVSEMAFYWQDEEEITLANAWQEYRKWCEDANAYMMMKRKFKTELKEYFEDFIEKRGSAANIYVRLKLDKFGVKGEGHKEEEASWLDLKEDAASSFNFDCAECYAQYATEDEIPGKKWTSVKTKLKDIDTSKLHYVKVPKNHIVIDFDLKDASGKKNLVLNKAAAAKFAPTYAEVSKGGEGLHLHYLYDGNVEELSRIYDDDIEVKVFLGGASLRRRLSLCNDLPITTISSGLPVKEKKTMIDNKSVESEKHLRALIKKCLNKEHHGHTAPEMDFIKHLTDQAYANKELKYDIRDLRPKIMSFAMSSTNQTQKCFDTASKVHFCSKDLEGVVEIPDVNLNKKQSKDLSDWNKAPIVFYDVEVFPNLFVICWKLLGAPKEGVIRMINPSPKEVEELFKFRLVGFFNRKYDNHIIYAASIGYSNQELFKLSQRITSGDNNSNCFFGNAFNLSYADIYDFATKKQSLKKWEIELGIHHLENSRPWDQPVDEKYWNEIADYCVNDVMATEAVWNECKTDFETREFLSKLSGLPVNATNRQHITAVMLNGDKSIHHVYTNLATGEVVV